MTLAELSSEFVAQARSLFERVEIPAPDDQRDWTLQIRDVLLSLTEGPRSLAEMVGGRCTIHT